LIYLDHNAGTPVVPEVAAAMNVWLGPRQANPASSHARGQEARAAVEEARSQVARLVGVRPAEVIFTASGSEADTLALVGGALARCDLGRRVVVSAIEHEAILTAGELLEKLDFKVVRVPPEADGRVDPGRFLAQAGDGTAIAALILASNETGVVQPVAEVARELRMRGVPFTRDDLGVDLLAISAHKFGGPQGGGALIVRQGTRLQPIIGGTQENGLRGGTPAVAAIAGLGAAAARAPERLRAMDHAASLRDRLAAALVARFPDARVHGQSVPRLPNTLSIAFPGTDARALVIALDLAGVQVSRGSACLSGAEGVSHVLSAMGLAPDLARGTLRLSLGPETTADEIETALTALDAAVDRARGARSER
jgi:cysteine desulfurase